jgi:hypothetical protein
VERLENRILLDGGFSSQQVITTSAHETNQVHAEDLDRDGDLDVLSASYGSPVAWYENRGGGSFGPENSISYYSGASSVYAADLDGDGDADALAAFRASDEIAWYENDVDGSGSFGSRQVITSSADYAQSVYAADLDGDGDNDVLSASMDDDKIAWYENQGGGSFGSQQVITTAAHGAWSVHAVDIDGDDDVDVLSASIDDGKIAWYENQSGGSFGSQQVITTAARYAHSVHASDLDGDGDPDVLSAAYGDNKIAWYENELEESGSFGSEQVITTSVDGPTWVHATDLDGDGDAEVLSASLRDDKIAWYENDLDGSGGFGPQQVITTAAYDAESVYAGDMDNDGDADVLSANGSSATVAWHVNYGPGNEAPWVGELSDNPHPVIRPHDLILTAENITDPDGDDLTKVRFYLDSNGDDLWDPGDEPLGTDTDSAGGWSVSVASDTLLLGEHTCFARAYDGEDWSSGPGVASATAMVAQSDPFGPQAVITTSADGARSVYAADLDRDGDPDVLSASSDDSKIAWYENHGGGLFGTQDVITASADGATSVYAADLDDDGDPDVLSASRDDNKIAWYENDLDGSGSFGPQQQITTSAQYAQSVYAADLDGDGDADVLSASLDDDKIAWYENQGGGNFGPQQVISTEASAPMSVYATDLDGDEDIDVLSAPQVDNQITWYENQGDGTFGAQQVIPTASQYVTCVYAADLDNDDDADVLSASLYENSVSWYENLGGGSFGAQQMINTASDYVTSVYATDLDDDDDVDVLSASGLHNRVAWYENEGGGSFGPGQVMTTDAGWAESVYATDLDGDGDADVLSASSDDDKIAWYVNYGPGNEAPWVDSLSDYPDPVIQPDDLTLTAENISDPDGDPVTMVRFYRDSNGDGFWDEADLLVGTDADATGGWSITFASDTLPVGENTYFARAFDGEDWSNGPRIAGTTVRVLQTDPFGPQQVITTSADSARSVYAMDLDGDADADVLSASYEDDKIAWYENDLDGSGGFGSQTVINNAAYGTEAVHAADLDGDGDADALSASPILAGPNVVWYENLDAGGFGPEQVIGGDANARTVYATDMDGDEDIDVLTAWGWMGGPPLYTGGYAVRWYENQGDGSFTGHWVDYEYSGSATSYDITAIYATDLDGDGDTDVLAGDSSQPKIWWFENDGGEFYHHSLPCPGGTTSLHAADLDRDGDVDVLAASASVHGHTVSWYENEGNGTFSSRREIDGHLGAPMSVYASDLDGDGDREVLVACRLADEIAWYDNKGDGDFGTQQVITAAADGAQSVYATDLDGDGDPDVLSASDTDDKIAWYENKFDGAGTGNNPPALTLENTVTELREDTDTSNSLKVADVVITDDAQGTNNLSLTGDDADLFEILGQTELHLQAGIVLDHETNPALNVTVQVDDPAVGDSPDDTAPLSVSVTDVNETPVVGSLSDSPDPVERPNDLVLTADGVSDPDAADSVTQVRFYLDSNGDGSWDAGDAILGTDTDPGDGWGITLGSGPLPVGENDYFVRAYDGTAWSTSSGTAWTTGEVRVNQSLEVSVGRGHDTGYPGEGDEEHDYWVEVGLDSSLSDLQVTTPWGEEFAATDYLPAGWSGEYFEHEMPALNLEMEAYEETGGNRHIEVEWDIPENEWDALDLDSTELLVSYSGGSWSGSVDFVSSPMPAQVPMITYPSHGATEVELQPTFTWEQWTSAGMANPGVWWELDAEPEGVYTYEEDHAPSGTTSWAAGAELAAGTAYEFALDFHHAPTVNFSGVDVVVESYLESAVEFTTGTGNNAPEIGDLSASPDPVEPPGDLTLSATDVADPDVGDTVSRVEFYLDTNADGLWDPGDEVLGTDLDSGDGWAITVGADALPLGNNTYFARACDGELCGDAAVTTGTVGRLVPFDSHLYDEDGVRVTVYDVNPEGPFDPDIAWSWGEFVWGTTDLLVDAGWQGDGKLNDIMLFGDGSETEDLGLLVEDSLFLGSFQDFRQNPVPMGFLASEGTVSYISTPGGFTGANVNGLTGPGGWELPTDLDEDGSTVDPAAVYTKGRVEAFVGGGDIDADVIAEEGVGFAMTRDGDWAGDLVSRRGKLGQLLVLDGDIDLRNGGCICSESTISAIRAINGDLHGDGDDGTVEVSVEDGSLWSLQASGGKIDGLAVDVRTTGGQLWQGAIGAIISSGSSEGIRRSCLKADHRIYSLSVQGPWQQGPGGAWAPTGDLADSVLRAGGLSSVEVGAGIRDSIFDIGGDLDWLKAGSEVRRTNVDAGNLGAVSVGSLGTDGGPMAYHLTDEADDWWLGIGGRWGRVDGTRDYEDQLGGQ